MTRSAFPVLVGLLEAHDLDIEQLKVGAGTFTPRLASWRVVRLLLRVFRARSNRFIIEPNTPATD
jgi:hypothetical protein